MDSTDSSRYLGAGLSRKFFKYGVFAICTLFTTNALSFDILAELQESAPKSFLENDQITGVCVDILNELDRRLEADGINIVIPADFTPIKRIMFRVKNGVTHIYCGAGRNAEREKIYNYSPTPLYDVRNIVIANSGEELMPGNFPELAATGSFVGGVFGASSTKYLRKQEGIMVADNFITIDEGAAALKTGRIRYFFYHDLGLLYGMKKGQWDVKVVPTIFREYQHWMISSKTLPADVTAKLNQAITEIYNDGTIETIKTSYRP